MRIKLSLRPESKNCTIPTNYQYPISAIIYKILSSCSPEYSKWLHNEGYLSPKGKPLKLFTFSFLNIPTKNRVIKGNNIQIHNNCLCHLYISSPMLKDFVNNFVQGMFFNQRIEIAGPNSKGSFRVESIDILPSHIFSQDCGVVKFKCLSPILVSVSRTDGRPSDYLRANDTRISEYIKRNLQQKIMTTQQLDMENSAFSFRWDEEYIERKGGYHKISKLITINEGKATQTKLKCSIAPFFLSGSPFYMQCAYECGIGEKNSLGLGMVDVVKKI